MTDTEPCPHCGAPVRTGSKFCRECGSDAQTGFAIEGDSDVVELPEEMTDIEYETFVQKELTSTREASARGGINLKLLALITIIVLALLIASLL